MHLWACVGEKESVKVVCEYIKELTKTTQKAKGELK